MENINTHFLKKWTYNKIAVDEKKLYIIFQKMNLTYSIFFSLLKSYFH